ADIAKVLVNCKRYLADDYNVFLVANDKYNLYPAIAELAGMQVVNKFIRPVLHRVEKDRNNLFSETIFQLKEK
ncbi:MAG: site-specific DNA-methyltransferase, partial [Limisphaerales bacterium]